MNADHQEQQRLTDEQRIESERLHAAIRRTFGTGDAGQPNNPDGARVLAWLEYLSGTTYGRERPSCQFFGPGYDSDGLTREQRTAYAEGRKSIVYELRAALITPADANHSGPSASA